jgi:hypothetical protein
MHLTAALAVLMLVAISGPFELNFARADDIDDRWTGPGWYQVFHSTEVYLIYSGPYASQSACFDYVKGLSPSYSAKMSKKYGRYGDEKNGWVFYCHELKSKAEWHDMAQ